MAKGTRKTQKTTGGTPDECMVKVAELEARAAKLAVSNLALEGEVMLHRETEEQLRVARERLAETLESMSEAFYVLDRRYRFTYLNRAARELYGKSADSMVGKSLWEVSPGLIDTAIGVQFTRSMEERVPVVVEAKSPLLGIWFEARLFPVPAGVSVYMRDVTERKEREEALRQQAELLDVTYDAITVRDIDNRLFFWNHGAEERYGWKKEEVMGKVSHDLLRTRFPRPLPEIRKDLFETGRWEGELLHTKRNGETVTVEARWALKRDGTGRPVAIMEISSDITERKKAEYDRLRLEAAIENVAEGLIVTAVDGTIEYANPAWCRMTGFSADELLGRDVRTVATLDGRPSFASVWDLLGELLASGESWSGRATALRRDGTPLEADITASPVPSPSGGLMNYILIGRDITEQTTLERQLRQAQKMEAIGTLAGGVAHDFNNILAAVVGFAELALKDQPKGSRPERFLLNISKAAMRGRDVARRILAASRQEEGKRKALVLAPVVRENLAILRASLQPMIRIVEDFEEGRGVVYADTAQVAQIVLNLCTNAAQAMKEKGGLIKVGLYRHSFSDRAAAPHPDLPPGDYLRLSVADTGHGIPPDIIDKVFDPFFTTKKPGEGTGLGLSVTKSIVKSHGGAVTVASKVGKGTVFDVYLPLADAGAKSQEESSAGPLPKGKERILFVDDEEGIVEVAKETLADLGYQVSATTDAIEALEMFRHDPLAFDLVITDQMMPNLTGIEMVKRMTASRPDLPVILLTGYTEALAGGDAEEAGVREVLMKPATKREMAEAIRRVVDGGLYSSG